MGFVYNILGLLFIGWWVVNIYAIGYIVATILKGGKP